MLYNVKDSNLLWFNVIPIDNFEMYYLFGAVLGLAIYNSTILELKFPTAIYKILLGLPVGLADYQEIFPEAAENLFKLRNYSEEELESIGLNFEVSFMDVFGRAHQRELIPGGTDVDVTTNNREKYIDKYARFFLMDGMFRQLHAFKNGFSSVVDGNAFSLFLPEEMQLLLCGSEESRFDVDVLQSVTSYTGWSSKEEALKSPTVKWFWEYVSGLTFKQQKKVLMFITGSDRVPATGIQNLSLKISRLNNGMDSDRLPVAHTCFNELSIYEYSSREKMIDKLTKAVNMLAGFGIK
ncbi:CIC11C00000001694 [Sungouiella intermedia]|uniref:HECT-type E3 ubiquitin transferase n=1 Tax=Sungouiella intermedia TaxID=45354 RepID=A0A1L0G026_9ASCO|nr:CIC11C00000001694 [[Candida] intermedia]